MLQFLVYAYLVVQISKSEGKNTNNKILRDSNEAFYLQKWKEEISEVRGFARRAVFKIDQSRDLSEIKPVAGCELTTPSNDDKERIVNFHNSMRRRVAKGLEDRGYNGSSFPKAKNMMALGYSDTVEKIAKKWVSRCSEHFGDHYITGDYKIIWRSLQLYTDVTPIPPMDFQLSAEQRYNTSVTKFFGPDAIKPLNGRNSQTGANVQSYTLMVNHAARSIGCAQAAFFNETQNTYYRFVLCNYAGSYKAKTPLYSEGEPCSDVAPHHCDNGLIAVPESYDNLGSVDVMTSTR